MGIFCVISLSRSTCHRSFPSDSRTEGGLFGQLIWRGISIHFLESSLTFLPAYFSPSDVQKKTVLSHRMAVLG